MPPGLVRAALGELRSPGGIRLSASGGRTGGLPSQYDPRRVYGGCFIRAERDAHEFVALMPVLDEGNGLPIGRQGRFERPERDVREAQNVVRPGVERKDVRDAPEVRRKEQIASRRAPAHVVDDSILKTKPGSQPNGLPPVVVDSIETLGPVPVQQHRHPVPVRRRSNLLEAAPLEIREGPQTVLLQSSPLAERAVVLDRPNCSGRGLHRGERPSHLREPCGRSVRQVHAFDLCHLFRGHPGVRHVAGGVEGARVAAQAVGVVLGDRLDSKGRSFARLCVDPVEPPSHVVAVQIGHHRLLVEPVGTPVIAPGRLSRNGLGLGKRLSTIQIALEARPKRRAEVRVDGAGPLPQSVPEPHPEAEEREPVVEGHCFLKECRARRVPLLRPGFDGMGPADVEAVEGLCVPRGLQHLGERPRIVRQHGRPHLHRKEGRVESSRSLLVAAFTVDGNAFHEPARGCEVVGPSRVRGKRSEQAANPKSRVDFSVQGMHELVGTDQRRPGRGARDERIVSDARGLNLLLKGKGRDEPVRPIRKAIHHDGHIDRRRRQTDQTIRPGSALPQRPSEAHCCVFLSLLNDKIKVGARHGPVLGRGRTVGHLIEVGVQLGDALRPSRKHAHCERTEQESSESQHGAGETPGSDHGELCVRESGGLGIDLP
jgi:hypothetical protein